MQVFGDARPYVRDCLHTRKSNYYEFSTMSISLQYYFCWTNDDGKNIWWKGQWEVVGCISTLFLMVVLFPIYIFFSMIFTVNFCRSSTIVLTHSSVPIRICNFFGNLDSYTDLSIGCICCLNIQCSAACCCCGSPHKNIKNNTTAKCHHSIRHYAWWCN